MSSLTLRISTEVTLALYLTDMWLNGSQQSSTFYCCIPARRCFPVPALIFLFTHCPPACASFVHGEHVCREPTLTSCRSMRPSQPPPLNLRQHRSLSPRPASDPSSFPLINPPPRRFDGARGQETGVPLAAVRILPSSPKNGHEKRRIRQCEQSSFTIHRGARGLLCYLPVYGVCFVGKPWLRFRMDFEHEEHSGEAC